jgi:hypothetical protein
MTDGRSLAKAIARITEMERARKAALATVIIDRVRSSQVARRPVCLEQRLGIVRLRT